jgi:hypothetical protein
VEHSGKDAPGAERRSDAADQSDEPASTASTPPAFRSAAVKAEPGTLGDDFLNAASAERRRLLANLEHATPSQSGQAIVAKRPELVLRLEAAALDRRPDEFVRELVQIGIPGHRARKIVHDETGEPVVVLAKALAMPTDVLLRILLFLNPVIGHSVERVFALVKLYDQLNAPAALPIVSSWQHRTSGEQRKGGYQPVHWDDERRGARGRTGISNQKSVIRKDSELPRLIVSDF